MLSSVSGHDSGRVWEKWNGLMNPNCLSCEPLSTVKRRRCAVSMTVVLRGIVKGTPEHANLPFALRMAHYRA